MAHNVTQVYSIKEGIPVLEKLDVDIIFMNAQFKEKGGIGDISKFLNKTPLPELIITTGKFERQEAEDAIHEGAWDYLIQTNNLNGVTFSLNRAIEYIKAKTQTDSEQDPVDKRNFKGLVGSSQIMKKCLESIFIASQSHGSVILTGETGTGKELVARAIHDLSPRSDNNFVIVDCAALPENLIESFLFGHTKGAYTGADKSEKGLINHANNGTLFLDEVSELPISLQKSFLRVLQEKKYRPVGSNLIYESDFRIISATNRNLDVLVRNGKFRNDLMFRLKTFSINLPPLRDRLEDIEELCEYHMSLFSKLYRIKEKKFVPEFFNYLKTYHWPGNIRELINTIERSLIMAKDETIIYAKHLPDYLRMMFMEQKASDQRETHNSGTNSLKDYKDVTHSTLPLLKEVREQKIAEIEEDYLKSLLLNTNGDVNKATKISGISKARLYALLKKYGYKPAMFQNTDK